MIRSEFGHVDSADWEELGDTLTQDAATGALELHIEDPCDFDEEPAAGVGWVLLDGEHLLRYSTVDGDDESIDPTITLIDPVPVLVEAGAPVHLWDPRTESVVTELVALVHIDGDDEGELIEAPVDQDLADQLPAGPRDLHGESVRMHVEDGEWRVVDVEGGAGPNKAGHASAVRFENTDLFPLAAAGAQTLTLSHEPIPGSVHVAWHAAGGAGLDQNSGEWTRAGKTLTIPDVDGLLEAGDIISVKYAYLREGSATDVPEPTPVTTTLVPIGALWRHKTGTSDTDELGHDPATYAAPGFDDSTWAEGETPMGYGYVDTDTAVPRLSDVWQRVTFSSSGGTLNFTAPKVDDKVYVYLDGVLVGSRTSISSDPITWSVAATAGEHVCAVYGHDTTYGAMYAGIAIEEVL